MGRAIEVNTTIPAPVAEVWDDIARLDRHVEWMADAHSIEFLTGREGAGTRMRVETRIGPLRTADVIEITSWEPPHRMAVRHQGAVSGEGEFLLEEADEGTTRFTWRETLELPWYFGGRLGAVVASPLLAAVWRRNLARLRDRFVD
jgi:uncharacterized protein YndB with AHSA1/START domain